MEDQGGTIAGVPSDPMDVAATKVGQTDRSQFTLLRICQQHGEDVEVPLGPGPPLRLRLLPFGSALVVEHKGGALWPSGNVLAHFVSMRLSPRLIGSRVLELGCGAAALPGLVAARLGACVTLTDQSEVAAVAQWNADANTLLSVRAVSLEWGPTPPNETWSRNSFDFILAADVLYDRRAHRAFAATLEWAGALGALAFIAAQMRGAGDDFFSTELTEQGWTARRLDIGDVFDAMGSNAVFRSNFDMWVCWRTTDSEPLWCGPAATPLVEGGCGSDHSDDPPVAPPETDSEESNPPLAPPEDSEDG